ncbi:hypothetical protein HMPREF0491_00475 [Lachnospiraceae oral taxon 107 str. F0167]|nr:hypothetical protein HMPREF0491_00475 [Lachnospiraceae oral taxon 107 str. F0167]
MKIVCRIDKTDNFKADEKAENIDFFNPNSFSYTFWNNKNRLPYWYSQQALDLLYISMTVFAADRLCLRKNAYDGWSREFLIFIPVLEYDMWQNAKSTLEEMLNFLSGDKWGFIFRKRILSENEKTNFNRWEKSKLQVKDYDQICMFSGGMDSFIGAIDLLESTDNKTLFVSHYGGGKGTKEFQDILKEKFIKKYKLESRDFHQYYAKVTAGVEDTTRTRSFMFFSHALAVASCLKKSLHLIIPENGFISLNIPSTFSRIGTSSTRTTHPHYMTLFQELLDLIGIKVKLDNPYQFKTKGEMLLDCKNKLFVKENLENTMSCSHPDNGRMQKEIEARHCGYCLPCVIRQAAIMHAGIIDNSSYRDSKFVGGNASKTCLNSYRLGQRKFNPKYAFMTIQSSGTIKYNIEDYASLYIRGMKELKNYLEALDG